MGARDAVAKALMGIKAFHSSPYDFDRFKVSKVGTGEGAQVYGHGLYFAENPKVSARGGEYWNSFLNHPDLPAPSSHAGSRLQANAWDRDKAVAEAQRDFAYWKEVLEGGGRGERDPSDPYVRKMFELRRDELAALGPGGQAGPRTYEVNIAADPAKLLDWDAPITRQSDDVQEALARHPNASRLLGNDVVRGQLSSPTGEAIVGRAGRGPEGSQSLLEAGIPGIKYLDEGSRGPATDLRNVEARIARGDTGDVPVEAWQRKLEQLKAQPLTSNFVIFDPDSPLSKVDILKKYGVAGVPAAGATGAMGSMFDPSQYEEAQQ